MSGQTKVHSIVEMLLNVGSGFIIAMLLWRYVVTPCLGIPYNLDESFYVTLLFTSVSIVRGYIWRRIGNYITERKG